jgi:hypothetical protein
MAITDKEASSAAMVRKIRLEEVEEVYGRLHSRGVHVWSAMKPEAVYFRLLMALI